MVRLIFILPGLFNFAPEAERSNLHFLQYLLAHSDIKSSLKVDGRQLFLSCLISGRETITESQLAYWSDWLQPPVEYCYYCEPVYMRADLADAMVFDHSNFTQTPAEARLLVDAINVYLQSDLHRLEIAVSGRWYLLSKKEISGSMPTLQEMQGRPVGGVLTDSTRAPEWRHLMSELQILLHQHPINAEREQRGELPVNGVWIHAGATVRIPGYAVRQVVTHLPDAQTICRIRDLDCVEELSEPEFASNKNDTLIFDESLQTHIKGRGLRLDSMETNWFRPAYFWLRERRVEEIIIDPADGRRFVIRGNLLKRFWRRRRPLDFYTKQIS